MALPLVAILGVLPTVVQSLGGLAGSFFSGDDAKIQKIVSMASAALGGVTWAVDAFEKIRDRLKGAPITAADYDEMIAAIDANSATLQQLHQDAVARDQSDQG